MRPIAALLLLVTSSCALSRGITNRSDVSVNANPDVVIAAASTQLQHHGFKVNDLGGGSLVTVPKAIQAFQRDDSTMAKGNQWFLRVQVDRASFTAGSRIQVTGFIVPKALSTTPVQQRAIPITSNDKKLFSEVKAASSWIVEAAGRKSPKQSKGARPD